MIKSRISIFFAAALAALTLSAAPARAAETFTIDGAHSYVIFKVMHLGVANNWGRFNEISGTVNFDEANPEKSSVNLEIKAESVDTGVAKRDKHLRDTDFFSAKEFPVITFKSKKVMKKGENQYEVTGDLFLHGVTKEITTTFTHTGTMEKDPWGNKRVGGETEFTIDRTDFGINYRPEAVGTKVTLYVSVEATHK